MNKKIILVTLLILLLATSAFAYSPKDLAINSMLGNPLHETLKLGTYDTGLIIVKDKPINGNWFFCILQPQQIYKCFFCGGCN